MSKVIIIINKVVTLFYVFHNWIKRLFCLDFFSFNMNNYLGFTIFKRGSYKRNSLYSEHLDLTNKSLERKTIKKTYKQTYCFLKYTDISSITTIVNL